MSDGGAKSTRHIPGIAAWTYSRKWEQYTLPTDDAILSFYVFHLRDIYGENYIQADPCKFSKLHKTCVCQYERKYISWTRYMNHNNTKYSDYKIKKCENRLVQEVSQSLFQALWAWCCLFCFVHCWRLTIAVQVITKLNWTFCANSNCQVRVKLSMRCSSMVKECLQHGEISYNQEIMTCNYTLVYKLSSDKIMVCGLPVKLRTP